MMSSTLRISLLIALLIYFVIIFVFLKKRSLTLKYTLLWFLAGVVMLLVTIWPKMLFSVTKFVGIKNGIYGLFVICIGFILVLLMAITSIVSGQRNKIKLLSQEVAFLEKRIRELEDKEETK